MVLMCGLQGGILSCFAFKVFRAWRTHTILHGVIILYKQVSTFFPLFMKQLAIFVCFNLKIVAAETPAFLLISFMETLLSCIKYPMYILSSTLQARLKTMVGKKLQKC